MIERGLRIYTPQGECSLRVTDSLTKVLGSFTLTLRSGREGVIKNDKLKGLEHRFWYHVLYSGYWTDACGTYKPLKLVCWKGAIHWRFGAENARDRPKTIILYGVY